MRVLYKNIMERNRFWNIAIMLLVFILCVAFPISLITVDILTIRIVRISLLAAFIIFALIYIKLTGIAHLFQGRLNLKNTLLLSPLFLIAFSDLFYITVFKQSVPGTLKWNDPYFIMDFVIHILQVFAEELVFRFVIQKNLPYQSKINKILVASGIFAACHIITAISYWDLTNPSAWQWTDLVIVIYTFFIGIILGTLYEYTNNLLLPIAFHLIFNVISGLWIASMNLWDVLYLVNCLVFAVFGIGYICLFYFVFTKRENR